MRRIWMLCALMLSLTASASTAEALTHRSVSHRARWVEATTQPREAQDASQG